MNKKLIIAMITTTLSASAYAEGPEVKLNGGFEVQAVYVKNRKPVSSTNYITGNHKTSGMHSTGHIQADAHSITESGVKYGAKLGLVTTARSSRKLASSLYVESNAGKWELGSDKSAVGKMKITPYTNACATAGGWDVWAKLDPSVTSKPLATMYISNFGGFADPKTRDGDQSEYSRKVTYYTPELGGFQLGLSYIPDTTNSGYTTPGDTQHHDAAKIFDASRYKVDIKNLFAGGLTYSTKTEDFSLKIALVGEMGKAKPYFKAPSTAEAAALPNPVVPDAKFKKLRTYTVGTEIAYKDVSLTAAYSDYMKSLTSPQIDTLGRNTRIYGFGARYNHPSKVSLSATYFASDHKKNKLNATTLGVEYKGVQGLMPYAEVTVYKTKGRRLAGTEIIPNSNKGTAVVVGMKIEF